MESVVSWQLADSSDSIVVAKNRSFCLIERCAVYCTLHHKQRFMHKPSFSLNMLVALRCAKARLYFSMALMGKCHSEKFSLDEFNAKMPRK